MNLLALWIALAVLFISLVALAIIARKNKVWYMVKMANPEQSVYHVYRTFYDKMWLTGEGGMMLFHTEGGKKVRINKHWMFEIDEE